MLDRALFKWLLLGLLSLWFAACEKPPQVSPLLFEVGQRRLSLEQFDRELQLSYPDLSRLPETEQLQQKLQLVHRLIERELIFAEAERIAVQVSPDELDAAVDELRGNYSLAEYQQILSEAGQTLPSWKRSLTLRLITRKVSDRVIGPKATVSDDEAEEYYLQHRDEFRRPAELRARQMLFDNVADAEQVLELLRLGGDFASLAKEHSLSPDRENGGDLGYFSKGQLPPEFDRVLFNMAVGQLSDPVQSPYGVHLFLVERRRRAGLRPFAAVKTEIIAKLSQQREEQAFQEWLETLHKNTRIVVHWDLLEKHPN